MAKAITQTIKVLREIPGEYVRAGETYTVERGRNGKGDAHFEATGHRGATYIREWRVKQELASGALTVLS